MGMYIYQGSIIANFLNQNGQQFKIPVYQRNYEWSKEQCKKLFEDIVQAAENNKPHFCGSIVFQPLAPIKGINNSIIIDGQQRLTTIYIMIKALADMAKDESEKATVSASLFNVDSFGIFTVDEYTKIKLKPAKSNNDQLLNLLYDKKDNIDKTCEIYRNYSFFCELIKTQQDKGLSVKDIYRGISMLNVAVIQLDDSDKAQEIFERINSTGVPLSLADKIRNFILMVDADQDRLYDEYWLNIEKLLPKEQISNFFIDYINFKNDGFVKENEAYDAFKEIFQKGHYTNESCLAEMLKYADYYHSFLFGDEKYSKEVNELLLNLQQLKQTTLFIFLFDVFDDYSNKIINEEILIKVLKFLLNYSIRRLVCEVGSNSLRGLYKTLYSRIFSNEKNKKYYYDSIVCFFEQLTSKDALIDDDEFKESLKYKNLYRKHALCKFLLIEIENQGKEKIETESLTIEHVLPQNKNLSTSWQNMLGNDQWEQIQEKYLHTLGNLTLTGYNSELGDLPFKNKKQKIEEIKTKVSNLYSDIQDTDKWDIEHIEKRADRLSKEVVRLFAIEEPENKISFADPRYKEYTCDLPDEATNKKPNYYVLQGERINTSNFADMLRSLIENLYERNSLIIENMAKCNEQIVPWSKNIMFSYEKEKITGNNKLGNTDIYESSGFGASHIMCIIKALLNKYDIDTSDFVYSAREN